MVKKIIKTVLVLLAALVAFQLVRVQLREEPETPAHEGLSRVRLQEIEYRTVTRTHSYTGRLKGIREAMLFPSVPGVVREKLVRPGTFVEEEEGVLLVDRFEEGAEFEYSRVRSPIGGRVMEIIPGIGERVGPQNPVATVADTTVMESTLHIPEEEAVLVKEGQRAYVRVKALGDMVFAAEVYEVEPALDRETMRRKVKIRMENPDRKLRPSMLCSVELEVKEVKEAKGVPLNSVIEREGAEGIFIIDPDNYARWRPVKVKLRGDRYAAVEGEFEAGERVAFDGHYGLVPDRAVEIID